MAHPLYHALRLAGNLFARRIHCVFQLQRGPIQPKPYPGLLHHLPSRLFLLSVRPALLRPSFFARLLRKAFFQTPPPFPLTALFFLKCEAIESFDPPCFNSS